MHRTHVVGDFILPNPIFTCDRWQLGLAVVGDVILIGATWALIAVASLFANSGFHALELTQLLSLLIRLNGFVAIFAAFVTLFAYTEGLYLQGVARPGVQPQFTLAKSVGWAGLLTGTMASLADGKTLSWPWFASGLLVNYAVLTTRRMWVSCRKGHPRQAHALNVLIVGAGNSGRAIERHLQQHPELGRTVVGFLDQKLDFGVLGSIDDLARVARATFADEIIVTAASALSSEDNLQQILVEARTHRLDVRIVPEIAGFDSSLHWIETWGEIPILAAHQERLPHGRLSLKRAFDLALASFLVLIAAPFYGAIAFLIAADSGLPILYRSERIGRKGRRFQCLKFRTMYRNADTARESLRGRNERQGPCFKISNDPRVTRIGRYLRRYSLDELPQLWNVLLGDMSLVGPRPHPPDDYARYKLEHLRRLDVTPGITGLWQVTARQDPSFEKNLSLDLEYIERWSLRLDLSILVRTLAVVLRGTGS